MMRVTEAVGASQCSPSSPLGAVIPALCSVVSDSLKPRGRWPARLLCPWDSPGRNTGVGCHALLQGIFPTQGSNPGLPHCMWILYHLAGYLCSGQKLPGWSQVSSTDVYSGPGTLRQHCRDCRPGRSRDAGAPRPEAAAQGGSES